MSAFSGKELYGKLKYPSADNLKKLFQRLGVDNLFDQLSGILRQDSKAMLESFGGLRTQLAHTGAMPGVSCRDVRERLRAMERFVGALDRIVFQITVRELGHPVWTAHLC